MELCKLELSEKDSITKSFQIEGNEVSFHTDIEAYEKACEELLKEYEFLQKSLRYQYPGRDIDKVVLIGGATKQPLIRKFVSKLFGMIPDTSINPDEAVALGTAIQVL